MAAIGLTMILLLFSFLLLFRFCWLRWETLRTRMKQRLVLLLAAHLSLLLLLSYSAWPLLPAGQAQGAAVVERFLSALRDGDNQTALNLIVPAPEEEMAFIRIALSIQGNRPVRWEVTEPNSRHYVFGEVTFDDGQSLDLFVGLEWEWEKARWGITMLEFGRDLATSKARFYLYSTFLPYSWFRNGVIFLSAFCILFTVWQVWRLRKIWANLQERENLLPNQAHNF
ncbi:MAG: hypothetical protein CL608_27780 [Anaerolineaceae bacterium]|nr:hypothetical protein [Anaerolineaceae bacterium]